MLTERTECKHQTSRHSNLKPILIAIGVSILSVGAFRAHAQTSGREDLQKQIHNFEAISAQANAARRRGEHGRLC